MDMVANILLAAGAFGAAVYCYILAQRLKSFQTLESGMGGAIAVLSAQVDDMTRAVEKAQGAAVGSAASLEALTVRAEGTARRLELILASMHDLPEAQPRAAAEGGGRGLRVVRRRGPRDDEIDE